MYINKPSTTKNEAADRVNFFHSTIYISVPGGHSYQYISTNKNLNAVSSALTAFKILFEPLIYTSLCCDSYFSSAVQQAKQEFFAQRARVDQAVGLYYRKENLTF